jgi:putative transposase
MACWENNGEMEMPRGARLDEPGAMHHVMVRGIERTAIVVDDEDRVDFLNRISKAK